MKLQVSPQLTKNLLPPSTEADTPLTTLALEVINATGAESAGNGSVAQTASITDPQFAMTTATPPQCSQTPFVRTTAAEGSSGGRDAQNTSQATTRE